MDKTELIENCLGVLIGKRLALSRRGGSMRGFQFGNLNNTLKGIVGDFALHIQCPWRLSDKEGIITGSSDLYVPKNSEAFSEDWNYEKDGNRQDQKLACLLKVKGENDLDLVNMNDDLVVQSVKANRCCDLRINFKNTMALELFPVGSDSEDWRFFSPGTANPHFVIEKAQIKKRKRDGLT